MKDDTETPEDNPRDTESPETPDTAPREPEPTQDQRIIHDDPDHVGRFSVDPDAEDIVHT